MPARKEARPPRAQLREVWDRLQRENVPLLLALSVSLLTVGAIAVFTLETASPDANIRTLGDAVWYVIVTMGAVGYGDRVAITPGGRAVAVVMMLGGMTFLSVLTATVASVLVTRRIKEERGLETLRLRDHLIVCGWNQYAERVLDGLLVTAGETPIVLVSELAEEAANDVLARYPGRPLRYVRGDAALAPVLERANVRQAKAAIALADATHLGGVPSDDRTTLITLELKSVKPDLHVTVEALDLRSEAQLRHAGADDIVISGEFNGFLLSSAAVAPGISAVVRPLLSRGPRELRRHPIPAEFVGRTFGELFSALRQRDGFLAVAIVSERRGLTLDDLLTDDTSLVDRFIAQQFHESGRDYLRFETGASHAVVNPPDSYRIGEFEVAVGIPGHP